MENNAVLDISQDIQGVKQAKQEERARTHQSSLAARLTLDELLSLDIPKPSWIINRVIPHSGLVAISGKPGSYKTFFAMWVALRAAANLPLFESLDEDFFCQMKPETDIGPTPTLFIEEENTLILMKDRLAKFKRTPNIPLHFFVDQGFKLDDLWLRRVLAEVELHNIKLIVMDPFSSVMGLEDENSNSEVSEKMDVIRKAFLKNGISVVFIHHPSKGDSNGASLRGAGDILGKCDVHLMLEKDDLDPKTVRVSYEKMRLIDQSLVDNFKMRLTGGDLLPDMEFRYLGRALGKTEEERERLANAILNFMQAGQEYTRKAVADAIGVANTGDKFTTVWTRLLNEKKVRSNLNGKSFYKNV